MASDYVSFYALPVCSYCPKVMGQVSFCWKRSDYERAAAQTPDGVIRTHWICPECAERELAGVRGPHGGPRSAAA